MVAKPHMTSRKATKGSGRTFRYSSIVVAPQHRSCPRAKAGCFRSFHTIVSHKPSFLITYSAITFYIPPKSVLTFSRFPASIAPSALPNPSRLCISSMNRMIFPSAAITSRRTLLRRSSNSPL
ncbi:hypothetical protein BC938DRAFT_477706 [Jimgerdemannia flammicorona]|uniref:Uncharacterized protein n=1 Tax=Jimgerdemannia flammicorona TaxID=994334 RepID=A0A433QNY5_9FUNG|nr:hypothetical protein BC938DRAFT_477706 [Jimgerdemannia flammicorona]